ncbi:MAG: membrane protein insertase YidC [Burkholderiales bacterium]|nr:membrane protein insertase YidC [Burkholderiales bacterium]
MQTQRMILWIVFSMSLLFLWDSWQKHNGHPSMFGSSTSQQAAATPAAGGADPSRADPSIPPPAATSDAGRVEAPAAPATSGKTLRLANDVLALDIDLNGGQVRRAELLKHRDLNDRANNLVLLQDQPGAIYLAQTGWVGGANGNGFPTHRTPMMPVDGNMEPHVLTGGSGAVQLSLTAESGGLKVVRTYTLARAAYLLDVKDEISNVSDAPLRPTQYMQLTRDGNKPPGESSFYSTYTGPVIYTDADKFQKVDFGSIDKDKAKHSQQANDGWAGIIQHYFVAAWIPPQDSPREYYTRKVDNNLYSVGLRKATGELAPGASATIESKLLIGPQDQRMLEKIAPGLDLTVDYGWLTVIAQPIYWLLEKLHGMVGNWGWAIVLLTIIIKTLFYPLQAASYRSMARMKAVTPRLQQIRERYGSDRMKMNQAMMELYKTEKINPLGGCLPIVVQIPVFISLYWVLLASVEMRNAPWLGWITDLSAPDPFYILPLVMAATMFIQVRLNPTPPDPIQAKMMMIMPLVFSVMFFFFPAGLVLYWLVNNIYSIVQQWLITRNIEAAASVAAAKLKR